MIVKPELLRQIRKGNKTVERIKVAKGPCRYRVGHDYLVLPGRDKPAGIKITVLDVERQRLRDMVERDAVAEGFQTMVQYARHWLSLHDRSPADLDTYDCWLRRHGNVEVWVVTFERKRRLDLSIPDTPIFLARDSSRGYTTDPSRMLPGEPEVLGLELRSGSVARARSAAEEVRRREILKVHRLLEHARTVLDEGVLTGLDLGADLASLEAHVREIEERIRAA